MLTRSKLVAFVPTANAARARVFYQEVLGLTLLSEDALAIVFDANGTALRVTVVGPFRPASHTVLGWEVANLPGAVNRLTVKGVPVERYPGLVQDDLGICTLLDGTRQAWFKDP